MFVVLSAAVATGAWYVVHNIKPTDHEIRLSGNIEVTEVGISFQIPGRVVQRWVDEGKKVSSDKLIAELDSADLQAEVALRQAELEVAEAALAELKAGSRPEEIGAAEAQLRAAEVEEDRLKKERNRASHLHEEKLNSTEQFDQATAAYNVAVQRHRQASEQYELVKQGPRKETIAQAAARVRQAKAALKLAEVRLSYDRSARR